MADVTEPVCLAADSAPALPKSKKGSGSTDSGTTSQGSVVTLTNVSKVPVKESCNSRVQEPSSGQFLAYTPESAPWFVNSSTPRAELLEPRCLGSQW